MILATNYFSIILYIYSIHVCPLSLSCAVNKESRVFHMQKKIQAQVLTN